MSVVKNYTLLSRGCNAENIYTKYTVTWDFIAAQLPGVSSGNIVLFQLPQGSKVEGVMITHDELFEGVSGTLKVSVGSDTNPTLFSVPTQDLVTLPVDPGNLLEQGGLFRSGSRNAVNVCLNIVSSIGNLDRLTAGVVNAYIKFWNVKTPDV